MSNSTDAELCTEHLWHDFREKLRAFLVRRLPDSADAEDVLQEVFLQLHEGADRLDEVENVEAWIYTIARRAVSDFYRTHYRRAERETTEATLTPEAETAEPALATYEGEHDVHEEVLSWIIPMIEELPEKYRIAVRMADIEGRTQQEVADRLGLSLSGAKSRVQRGRVRLGKVLQECCTVEFGSGGRAVSFERKGENCSADC